jgi:hypothetical protein
VRFSYRRVAALILVPIVCLGVLVGRVRPAAAYRPVPSNVWVYSNTPRLQPRVSVTRSYTRPDLTVAVASTVPVSGIVTHTFRATDEAPPTPVVPSTAARTLRVVLHRSISDPRGYAATLVTGYQYVCLDRLWSKESHWESWAKNKYSSAYGIAQMITETSSDPLQQVRDGIGYIHARYHTACNAWAHEQRDNWY